MKSDLAPVRSIWTHRSSQSVSRSGQAELTISLRTAIRTPPYAEPQQNNTCIAECYQGYFLLQNVENYQNYEKRPSSLGSESDVGRYSVV